MADHHSITEVEESLLKDLLRDFKYKPGWKFRIDRGYGNMPGHLIISFDAIDADEPKKTIPIQFSVSLPALTYDDFPWTRWLFDQIVEVERHEVAEFFQVNGKKVFDPHG